MTVITPSPALRAGTRMELAARAVADRLAVSAVRVAARRRALTVTNEVAPLVLIAVISVAAAVALIALIGAAAAWLYYCQVSFGRNFWPAVNWPSQNGGLFYLACVRI